MPANKNALLRYKTIDNCLRNRQRRWTLQDSEQALYIETKPIHSSQMVLERNEDDGSVLFQAKVVLNFEFYALMLSYGSGVKILSPKCAVRTIRKMLNEAASQYNLP